MSRSHASAWSSRLADTARWCGDGTIGADPIYSQVLEARREQVQRRGVRYRWEQRQQFGLAIPVPYVLHAPGAGLPLRGEGERDQRVVGVVGLEVLV